MLRVPLCASLPSLYGTGNGTWCFVHDRQEPYQLILNPNSEFLNRKGSLSFFCCCCGKIPWQHLREKGWVLVHNSRRPSWWGNLGDRNLKPLVTSHPTSSRGVCTLLSISVSVFCGPELPAQGVIPPTVKMGLPESVNRSTDIPTGMPKDLSTWRFQILSD